MNATSCIAVPGAKGRAAWMALAAAAALLGLVLGAPAHASMTQDLAKARQVAKSWQADAVLVEVQASGALPGNKSQPGLAAMTGFTFTSQTAQQMLQVMMADGQMQSWPAPISSTDAFLALPANFIDLDAALAVARRKSPGASITSADLKTYADRTGQPVRAAWLILSESASFYVDAASGAMLVPDRVALRPGEQPGDDEPHGAGAAQAMVHEIQDLMVKLGYAGVQVTGRMDDETRAAIFQTEREHHMAEDSEASPAVLTVLQSDYDAALAQNPNCKKGDSVLHCG